MRQLHPSLIEKPKDHILLLAKDLIEDTKASTQTDQTITNGSAVYTTTEYLEEIENLTPLGLQTISNWLYAKDRIIKKKQKKEEFNALIICIVISLLAVIIVFYQMYFRLSSTTSFFME